jgi:hypothetical protein
MAMRVAQLLLELKEQGLRFVLGDADLPVQLEEGTRSVDLRLWDTHHQAHALIEVKWTRRSLDVAQAWGWKSVPWLLEAAVEVCGRGGANLSERDAWEFWWLDRTIGAALWFPRKVSSENQCIRWRQSQSDVEAAKAKLATWSGRTIRICGLWTKVGGRMLVKRWPASTRKLMGALMQARLPDARQIKIITRRGRARGFCDDMWVFMLLDIDQALSRLFLE